jgi:hypothetical protein
VEQGAWGWRGREDGREDGGEFGGGSGDGVGGAEEEDVVEVAMSREAVGEAGVDFGGDQFFQGLLDLGAQARDVVEAREFETFKRGAGRGC